MEVTGGELRVPLLYFYDAKKFWYHVKNLLTLKNQAEYWLKVIIQQPFLNDRSRESFAPMSFRDYVQL